MVRRKLKLSRPKNKKKIDGASSSSVSQPPWIELPRDVTANILGRLGTIDLLENARRVCATWWSVCKDPAVWRVIDMQNSSDSDEPVGLANMCRYAVDSSQGQLVDINIEYFGSDELLHYIAERSSQLRCLRLACCRDISGKGLSEAVKRFLQLEELHLFFMKSVTAEDIETIGPSCPMLKSLTFNGRGFKFAIENDDYAQAVAKSMPGLCHLRLFGNKMTTHGLEAILDGCPRLKSLDIRQCFGVNLQGDISTRCSLQIKELRAPCDTTADYEWDAEIYDDSGDDITDDEGFYPYEYTDMFPVGYYEDYTNPLGSVYFTGEDVYFNYDDFI